MHVDGACHCGLIRFEAEVDPATVAVCHCIDCQVLSGAAFRVVVPAPAATFRVLGGTPRIYVKVADSGNRRVQAFCPECGSPIYSTAPENPTLYSLRLGTLRQRAELAPQAQNWTRSALPWVDGIATLRRNPGQP